MYALQSQKSDRGTALTPAQVICLSLMGF